MVEQYAAQKDEQIQLGDLVGTAAQKDEPLLNEEQVLAISTDYRDYRKAAFQEFAVSWTFNTLTIPKQVSSNAIAGVGVGFVAAAFTLGICFGLSFPSTERTSGLDLLLLARSQPKHLVPEDVRHEVFRSLALEERLTTGDWIVINGGMISNHVCLRHADFVNSIRGDRTDGYSTG